jgi:hypothetical protein
MTAGPMIAAPSRSRSTIATAAVLAMLVACGRPPAKQTTVTPPPAPAGKPLARCPTHAWSELPATSGPRFGEACGGRDDAACQQRCDQGVAMACVELGTDLASRQVDFPRQLELFTRACDAGDAIGCTNLGATVELEDVGWTPNYACAVPLFAATCRAGEPHGCTMLAAAYLDGHGVARDPARARDAFARGCDRALADASHPPGSVEGVLFACQTLLTAVDDGKLRDVPSELLTRARLLECELGGPC